MSAVSPIQPSRDLFSRPQHWAARFGPAPFLPISHEEVDQLGWDGYGIILMTSDAYVDHPSFGAAVCGHMLEAQGFRVGTISQPDQNSKDDFMRLGKPNLFFGMTTGNMDSVINCYTTDHKLHYDDAYTAGNVTGKRPDRATLICTQHHKEAWKDVPVILGGTEANLRHATHYDYRSDTVRRPVLVDSRADILMFDNGEHPLVEIAHCLATGEAIDQIRNVRNITITMKGVLPSWSGADSTHLDALGEIDPIPHPYGEDLLCADNKSVAPKKQGTKSITVQPPRPKPWKKTYVPLPSFEEVKGDKVLYVHTSCILHHETSPDYARALVQKHGECYTWINPPTIPLSAEEVDSVFELPYERVPHPTYGNTRIPAYEMIRFSINIMRGCFGGCSLCSITEHGGRIIQSRSEDSIISEIEAVHNTVPGFTGVISDLGEPATDIYMLRCKSPHVKQTCRHLSYVYPDIYPYMGTNHESTVNLYCRTRKLKDIKKILIASGVRYDIATGGPRYIKGLATHHVGGYLGIAPKHTEEGLLSKMMKPGMNGYDRFKELFDTHSKQAGKEQYPILYFISAHPGTRDEDMVNLVLWLKKHHFRLDQVQNFYPSLLTDSTTTYCTGKNPLDKIGCKNEEVMIPKGDKQRRLHRALLRYHDPAGWPLIRRALGAMGRKHLIGSHHDCLVPAPTLDEIREARHQDRHTRPALTKHTPVVHQHSNGETTAKEPVKRDKVAGR